MDRRSASLSVLPANLANVALELSSEFWKRKLKAKQTEVTGKRVFAFDLFSLSLDLLRNRQVHLCCVRATCDCSQQS